MEIKGYLGGWGGGERTREKIFVESFGCNIASYIAVRWI